MYEIFFNLFAASSAPWRNSLSAIPHWCPICEQTASASASPNLELPPPPSFDRQTGTRPKAVCTPGTPLTPSRSEPPVTFYAYYFCEIMVCLKIFFFYRVQECRRLGQRLVGRPVEEAVVELEVLLAVGAGDGQDLKLETICEIRPNQW